MDIMLQQYIVKNKEPGSLKCLPGYMVFESNSSDVVIGFISETFPEKNMFQVTLFEPRPFCKDLDGHYWIDSSKRVEIFAPVSNITNKYLKMSFEQSIRHDEDLKNEWIKLLS